MTSSTSPAPKGVDCDAAAPALGGAAVVSRSNGLEHLNYRRMLDDH